MLSCTEVFLVWSGLGAILSCLDVVLSYLGGGVILSCLEGVLCSLSNCLVFSREYYVELSCVVLSCLRVVLA